MSFLFCFFALVAFVEDLSLVRAGKDAGLSRVPGMQPRKEAEAGA